MFDCVKYSAVFGIPIVASLCSVALGSGTTGADFLNVSVSAYEASLGGASSALSNGIASSYFNPSGLAYVERPGVNLMHNSWYQDIAYEFLGAAFPLNSRSTIGISAAYLHMGEIDTYNELDQRLGTTRAYSTVAIVSACHSLPLGLSFGLSGKFIAEKLAEVNSNGWAVDVGAQYRITDFMFGAVVNNVGPRIAYDEARYDLPTSISIAAGLEPRLLPAALMVGGRIPIEGDASISIGLDYTLSNNFSLRSGVRDGRDVNFGAGLEVLGTRFDYAYNPNGIMGQTHFFSLTVNFGQARDTSFGKPEAGE